jgi:glutamyl-tRNA(Gln) amidotransferase subunit D
MEDLAGYRGAALAFLKGAKAEVGDVLEVETEWGKVKGTIVPRYLYNDDAHVVLKLSSGYNVGLAVARLKGATVKAKGEKPSFNPPPPPKAKSDLPRVVILGTGGTIASRVDYRTGAVRPATTAGELYALIPELSDVAKVEPEILLSIYSENIDPSHWKMIAERVGRAVHEGAAGIVVTMGTDTMGYTAAALGFALSGVPIPVVITAAQRSSDRPSTDAVLNLIAAVSIAADAPFSGVYVAMHLDESDEKIAVHAATRVRKNHTSRRDAFQSIGTKLAAVWGRGGFDYLDEALPSRRAGGEFRPKAGFEPKVALLKFYPSMPATQVEALAAAGTKAIVLEGTGLGHVNKENVAAIQKYVSKGGLVFMTSQCVNGLVDLNVYETGRDLLDAGVIPLEDMLSETATAKAMWALANSGSPREAASLMVKNLAGEIAPRRFPT